MLTICILLQKLFRPGPVARVMTGAIQLRAPATTKYRRNRGSADMRKAGILLDFQAM
jgi:hypothetical protein